MKVPIYVYRCPACGSVRAMSEDSTAVELECWADSHGQVFMELILDSSVEAAVPEDAA